MSFTELFQSQRPVISFEFFPPKSDTALPQTQALMSRLAELDPDFMSVTYGAGGGTRDRTKDLVSFIHNQLNTRAVSHLTCVGHSRSEIEEIVEALRVQGVLHLLALRGDPPRGDDTFCPHPEGFENARDLARFLKAKGGFHLAVAGYPEIHPDAVSMDADIQYLKEKVESGGELIITQLFFESSLFFRFQERCVQSGITTPILPGIMPISNVAQIKRFTSMCGASVPKKLHDQLESLQDDPESVVQFGIEYAISQCQELLSGGAPGVHFYTLNKSVQVEPIALALGLGKQSARG